MVLAALVAAVSFATLADNAHAGVIIAIDAAGQAGMQPPASSDELPSTPRLSDGWLDHLSLLLNVPSGATGGASSGSSVSSSTSSSALCWAACGLPLPELISVLQGEGPLFFQPPPVVELLKPPKV